METMNGVKGRAHEFEMQQVNVAGFNCELSPLGGPGLLSGLGVRLSASVRPSAALLFLSSVRGTQKKRNLPVQSQDSPFYSTISI